MLNYASLNDVEFEYLCRDIIQKKLGCFLRGFSQGKDGGIDLTDDVRKKKIVIQVKHYMNSSAEHLIRSLRQETEKIEKIKPTQYYICCSKNLSPQKARTREQRSFKKHYKLWLDSTGILEQLDNNDSFIDCEALLLWRYGCENGME